MLPITSIPPSGKNICARLRKVVNTAITTKNQNDTAVPRYSDPIVGKIILKSRMTLLSPPIRQPHPRTPNGEILTHRTTSRPAQPSPNNNQLPLLHT